MVAVAELEYFFAIDNIFAETNFMNLNGRQRKGKLKQSQKVIR